MNTCKENFIPAANTYHGLKNQGATCYLNSVLQVLFMTKEFREAVKRKKSETEHIDLQLTTLFDDLTKRTAQTHKITQKLGINRVHEQRDAAEYFEKILRHTSPEASQIFQGQLTHKNICLKCHTETDTDGPVWSLPLALKDSHSDNYRVVDGIKEFFKASDVSGDNQMYCDECDDKADATMKCVMKHHPEVLVLLLKRFEFDYRFMEFVKISSSVDVPCTLKIPEKKTYELYGFVDHFGDLRGGHYTATIKCQDDKRWYNFNDTMVTKSSFQMDNIMKSSSAYLLFYRKKTVKAADRDVSTNAGAKSDSSHTRKRKKDEEAAGGGCYTVDKQENKKRIVDNRGDTEIKTGDDEHAVKREKILVKNNQCEGQDNVDQTSQDIVSDYQNSGQTTRHKQSTRSKKRKSSKQHHNKDVKHVEEGEKILRKNNHGEGQDNERVDQTSQESTADCQNSEKKTTHKQNRSKKRKPSKQHHKKDVEHQGKETLDNVSQNKSENQEGKQEEDSVCVDKQRGEEKPVKNVKVDQESTTAASEREKASVSGKGNSDPFHGLQKNEGVDDCKENMSKNQTISNTSPIRHEQQEEEKRDIQKNKEQMTTEFEDAQMGDTSMTHQDNGKLGDDRHNEGVGDSKKNMSNNQGICNTSPTRHEKLREEKNDVKKDKEDMTREIKHTVTGDTSMTHQHSGKLGDVRQEQRSRQNSGLQLDYEENKGNEDIKEREINEVVYADNRRVDDKPVDEQEGKKVESRDSDRDRQQNRGEYECTQRSRMSGSHGSEGVEDKPQEPLEMESGHKDVGVETSVKVEETYNRHIQNRKESFRQTQSAGSRDLTENQRVNSGQLTPCEQGKGEFSLKAEHESKKKKHRKGRKSLLNFFSCGLLKRKKKRDRSSESE